MKVCPSLGEFPCKFIYLRFADSRTEVPTKWHKINASLAEAETTFVTKIPLNIPIPSNSVALGSILYVIGGSGGYTLPQKKSRDVYYLDTRLPDLRWKIAPSLIHPRGNLILVTNNGKIYAVGHTIGDRDSEKGDESWCEVFDPLLNTWQPVLGPDTKTLPKAKNGRFSTSSIDDGEEGFLVDATEGTFWYNLDVNSWRPMSIPYLWCRSLEYGSRRCDGAIVDDVAYLFHRRVWGYNLRKGGWSEKEVKGLRGRRILPYLRETNGYGSPEQNYPRGFVVNVGNGRLCLVHETYEGIHCTRFRICVHCDGDEDSELLATIEAFRVYPNHQNNPYDDDYYSRKLELDECLVI